MVGKLGRALAAFGLFLFAVIVFWAIWASTGRVASNGMHTSAPAAQTTALGNDTGRGNLLAIQPWVTAADYASADALRHKLGSYLAQAQSQGWLKPATIAVFPEYTGTWLVAAGEKVSAIQAQSIESALTTVALTHLPSFAWHIFQAPEVQDATRWALFTVKSEQMARDYTAVFGGLAQKYGVHIVAGSIVLPEPTLVEGALRVRPGGSMRNVSAVFGPDGKIIPPLVIKAFPIDEEQTFSIAGGVRDIPVFETPAGRLGVLICADSWFPAAYSHLQQLGANLIAVPSYSSGENVWQSAWMGYNGAPTERDVLPADIGKLTEAEAWMKYAMAARAPAHGMPNGVNVFLRGDLWGLGSDGTTVALHNGKTVTGPLVRQATLTNLWLQ